MGIPKFARFIITRYPLVLQKLKENPTMLDLDNLYLDLNGIIHIMSHNNSFEKMLSNRSYQDIYYDVFKYIDELVHLMKPNKVLMIAADGVAPRAKMNQQRTRRFKKTNLDNTQLAILEKEGKEIGDLFNSDCISPGTEFMHGLAEAFDLFISLKVNSDPVWKNLKVILSNADIPGEGEHKIVDYIRQYKASKDFNKDESHCIYGLDADLIMLGLVTHIPNVCILREETQIKKKKGSYRSTIKITDNFELIHISLLREYLELEFAEIKEKINFEYNSERIIDDFLFICFFIGNDFLPSLNTLDIEEGSLDKIFDLYKQTLPQLDDYITFHGKIDFKKAEVFFKCLSRLELDSLQSMLKKLDYKVKERTERREKIIESKKVDVKKRKLALKKLKKFKEIIKNNSAEEKKKIKKTMINKKIAKLKESYLSELNRMGLTNKVYEEDIRKIKNNEPLFSDVPCLSNININSKSDKNDFLTTAGEESSSAGAFYKVTDNQRNLVGLFGSSDEDENKKPKKQNPKLSIEEQEALRKNIFSILKTSVKYYNHIQDPNYNSDLNVNDFNDSDVSAISEDEIIQEEVDFNDGFNNNLIECQDFEKVFQQKLIDLYIQNVKEAKKFYYSEKVKINLNQEEGVKQQNQMFQKYLEGLQWVLYYYYRGIPSWKWYYPYHYPPMISDFQEIDKIITYDLDSVLLTKDESDKPLRPFQSLLMILPETSKNLLPSAYHTVYRDYPYNYPTKFIIDFNGKRLPWEALVILPFVNQNELVVYEEAIRSKFHFDNKENLSQEEKDKILTEAILERNRLGHTWVYTYDKSKAYFPNLKKFKFFETNLNYFRVNRDVFLFDKEIKYNLSYNYEKKDPSFKVPTLSDIKFQWFFNKISTYKKREGKPAKKLKVLTVNPNSKFDGVGEEEVVKEISNALQEQELFVSFPFKSEAKVIGVTFNDKYYYVNNKGFVSTQSYKVSNDLKNTCKTYLHKQGIYLETVTSNIFLEIVPFDRYVKSQNGNLVKLYHENERFFTPIEMTSLNAISSSYIKLKTYINNKYDKYRNTSTEFKQGDKCLLLTNSNYGVLSEVETIVDKFSVDYKMFNELNYSEKYYDSEVNYDLSEYDWKIKLDMLYSGDLVAVNLLPQTLSSKTNFSSQYTDYFTVDLLVPKDITQFLRKTDEFYISMDELSRRLGVSVWTLSIISSCVYISSTDDQEEDDFSNEGSYWNIGLNLKSNKGEKYVLPGYTRYFSGERNSTNWEFSSVAVKLIEDYITKYEFVFRALDSYDQTRISRCFKVADLFPPDEETGQFDTNKLNEITRWISAQGLGELGFATHNSNFMSVRDIKRLNEFIEKKIEILQTNSIKSKPEQYVVNPNYLVSDSLPYVERFGYTKRFSIGDRVVNVRSDDKKYIPFGLKGVITGTSEGFYEVMFDVAFFGGNTCGGRLPEGRGAYLIPENLLNLTQKEPVFLRRNNEKFNPINYKLENIETSYSDYFDYPALKKYTSYKNQKFNDGSFNNYDQQQLNKAASMQAEVQKPKKIQLKTREEFKEDKDKEKTNQVAKETTTKVYNPDEFFEKDSTTEKEKEKEKPYIYTQKKIMLKTGTPEVWEKNGSLYNKNRLFENEKIKKNEVYYFGKAEIKEKLKMFNQNIV